MTTEDEREKQGRSTTFMLHDNQAKSSQVLSYLLFAGLLCEQAISNAKIIREKAEREERKH